MEKDFLRLHGDFFLAWSSWENKMFIKNKILRARKIISGVMLLAVFLSAFGAGDLPFVDAQGAVPPEPVYAGTPYVLSDGQFVYGPNIGNFKVKTFLESSAPHLLKYADDLYGRSEYFSINPKIYLTLLEIQSQLISDPQPERIENPYGMLEHGGFIPQVEILSSKMMEAYYLHLYSYSALGVSQRELKPFVTPGGTVVNVAPGTNAGTYAVIAGLAAMDHQNISSMLDNSHANGFYQTYVRLFGSDDPLDEKNQITIPAETSALAAPSNLLQLPYLQGLSWRFGGVHNNSGTTNFTDASSLDFYPWPVSWGADTSTMWVVAAAPGIPTRYSDCGFKISHSGALNTGWETTYYHLEGAKFLTGSIKQNDKIGVIANTLAEATCTGGSASGPHVHFSLKYNGAYVAINGTPLSGWFVHSGRYSYDVDPNYMWLEKAGQKKYAYGDVLLSEGTSSPPAFPCTAPPSGGMAALNFRSDAVKEQTVPGPSAQNMPVLFNPALGSDTTGVFRPGNGLLYLKNSNTTGFADVAINYGLGGDYPVTGDWDGNGTATIGIYRNGVFYLRNSNTLGFADLVFAFGSPGDQPLAGDWNGDGVDTVGVYNSTAITFCLRNSNTSGLSDISFLLGIPGDVGIAGDWNGDGVDTTGVFRPSNGVIFLKNINTSGFADVALNYGLSGDQPVTGDWDNDGMDTIGVYRNGSFYLRNSNTLGFADLVFALGNPGDMPIAGNWDGVP